MQKDIDIWDELRDSWPAPIITREAIGKWSGGLLRPAYLRNLDCQGQGPPRIKSGRKVAYPIAGLVAWLRARSQVIDADDEKNE